MEGGWHRGGRVLERQAIVLLSVLLYIGLAIFEVLQQSHRERKSTVSETAVRLREVL